MKKVFSVLLVAVLAVSTVFAGLSGSVSTSAGYNLDTNKYGFFGTDAETASVTLTLGEENVEKLTEGDVYASVKAGLKVTATTPENVNDGKDHGLNWYAVGWTGSEAKGLVYNVGITEAKIGGKLAGQDWYISLLGMGKPANYAGNFADADADYKVPFTATNGLEAGYAGFKAGFGLNGQKDKGTSMAAYVETPAFTIVDGLTIQGNVAYSHSAVSKPGLPAFESLMTDHWEKVNGVWTWITATKPVDPVVADKHNMGGNLKVAYANDVISASVATDMGVKNMTADKPAFGMDLALNFKYDFISTDFYYGYKDLVNFKVAADLNSFDVPVKVALGLNNIATDKRSMTAEVGFEGYGATANFTSEFGFKKDADWKIGFNASYDLENIAKFAASVSYDNKENLGMSVSAENTTLIDGVTLGIGWYGASDLLEKNNSIRPADVTDQNSKWIPDHADKGVVKASVKVVF